MSNKPCGPSKIVFWPLFCSIKWEKIAQNLFFTGKIAFLFKKFCFQQPLRSWRNDLSFSTVNVRLAFELIEIVPWGLSNSKTRWKIGQKFFLTGKIAFFSKNCVFNNLSSPDQTILVFPQYLSEKCCGFFINCSRRFVTIDNTMKG